MTAVYYNPVQYSSLVLHLNAINIWWHQLMGTENKIILSHLMRRMAADPAAEMMLHFPFHSIPPSQPQLWKSREEGSPLLLTARSAHSCDIMGRGSPGGIIWQDSTERQLQQLRNCAQTCLNLSLFSKCYCEMLWWRDGNCHQRIGIIVRWHHWTPLLHIVVLFTRKCFWWKVAY